MCVQVVCCVCGYEVYSEAYTDIHDVVEEAGGHLCHWGDGERDICPGCGSYDSLEETRC